MFNSISFHLIVNPSKGVKSHVYTGQKSANSDKSKLSRYLAVVIVKVHFNDMVKVTGKLVLSGILYYAGTAPCGSIDII